MQTIGVFFGQGYEEIEALTVVDLLRRAGIETSMISITDDRAVPGSHGIPVGMDQTLQEVDFDALAGIVLPGGMKGTQNLEACEVLMKQVDSFAKKGKLVCAICAAPSILGHRGLLTGKKATVYPGMEGELHGATPLPQPAVTDGEIITGRGMGCAIAFGLAIVEKIKGAEEAKKLAKQIVYCTEDAAS